MIIKEKETTFETLLGYYLTHQFTPHRLHMQWPHLGHLKGGGGCWPVVLIQRGKFLFENLVSPLVFV